MDYYPKNTLAYQMTRPLLQQKSIETAPCPQVAKLLTTFKDTHKMEVPETEALEFYQLSHAMALVQQRRHIHEPLPEAELELVAEYFTIGSKIAQRAFYYLVMICGREARHLHNKSDLKTQIEAQFGKPVYSFICTLPDSASTAAHKFLQSAPKAPLGNYMKALSWIFYKGSWGGGYGGKKWGSIADCAVNFTTGKFSPAMMVDTVWTLCHNNGPIFNKGEFYSMYSGNALVQILDAQRAGMIPALINDGKTPMANMTQFITSDQKLRNEKIYTLFPDLPRTVDWDKVQELGAVLKYSAKAKANAKHKVAGGVVAMLDKELKIEPPFIVYPGFSLPKAQIKRAA